MKAKRQNVDPSKSSYMTYKDTGNKVEIPIGEYKRIDASFICPYDDDDCYFYVRSGHPNKLIRVNESSNDLSVTTVVDEGQLDVDYKWRWGVPEHPGIVAYGGRDIDEPNGWDFQVSRYVPYKTDEMEPCWYCYLMDIPYIKKPEPKDTQNAND